MQKSKEIIILEKYFEANEDENETLKYMDATIYGCMSKLINQELKIGPFHYM